MLDYHDPKQAYEIFRLQWMIEHGYGIPELIKNLEAMIEETRARFVTGLSPGNKGAFRLTFAIAVLPKTIAFSVPSSISL